MAGSFFTFVFDLFSRGLWVSFHLPRRWPCFLLLWPFLSTFFSLFHPTPCQTINFEFAAAPLAFAGALFGALFGALPPAPPLAAFDAAASTVGTSTGGSGKNNGGGSQTQKTVTRHRRTRVQAKNYFKNINILH